MASMMRSSLLVVVAIATTTTTQGFIPQNSQPQSRTQRQQPIPNTQQLHMVPPDAPAGSFFNPVPSEDDGNNDGDDGRQEAESQKEEISSSTNSDDDSTNLDIDDQLTNLLRQRSQPPLASTPSTINGIPTAKASGFGKKSDISSKKTKKAKAKADKPYVAIGPPSGGTTSPSITNVKLNDPSNPEYDDQGYTLYSDEKTGQKSRVFEALVDYPCDFTMKIVGANEGQFVSDIVSVVAEACDVDDPKLIPHTTRAMGKWTSVTVKAPVKNAEMLYALYEKVDLDPRVKFKF